MRSASLSLDRNIFHPQVKRRRFSGDVNRLVTLLILLFLNPSRVRGAEGAMGCRTPLNPGVSRAADKVAIPEVKEIIEDIRQNKDESLTMTHFTTLRVSRFQENSFALFLSPLFRYSIKDLLNHAFFREDTGGACGVG
ncbi:serine/threonine-protein kinase WNK1-like isoform X1 [Lates japonicus]|uniref:Serine/threonine-protein kinase WNK1-like isoform X1 n=1 Tax=Lates japonicus TaxID=270547 RepID=A0AAD3NQU4_LATJO|nr:serine/threonine-protein kinase WNK1-like isoform X1 [Lates japonicus]